MLPTIEQITLDIEQSKKGKSTTTPVEIYKNIAKVALEREAIMKDVVYPNTNFANLDLVETDRIVKSGEVFVSYVRSEKTIMKKVDEYGKTTHSIVPGKPLACLVSFMYKGYLHIGWSLRNTSREPLVQNVRNEIIKWGKLEPVPYTKKIAIKIAILRALSDKVHIETERKYSVHTSGITQSSVQTRKRVICHNDAGERLSNTVSNELPHFVERSLRWFKQNRNETPVNVSYLGTVKDIDTSKRGIFGFKDQNKA